MSSWFRKSISINELGDLLYAMAAESVTGHITDDERMKSLGLDYSNLDHISRELLIINFFFIIWVIDSKIKSEQDRDAILDRMHDSYYRELYCKDMINESESAKDYILTEHNYITSRYDEYTNARNEKEGPEQLWSLSRRMLHNLHNKDVKDIVPIMAMTMNFSAFMSVLCDTVDKFKIVAK
jgi:hypothetical protein